MKRKRKGDTEGAPAWMVTFGDMTTLLLTFFIILLSVAKIDGEEMKIIFSNFPGLDKLLTGVTFVDGPIAKQSLIYYNSVSDKVDTFFDTVEQNLMGLFDLELQENIVELTSDERGLVINLAADHFFDRYSAELNLARSSEVLRKVAELLKDFDREVGGRFRIEGHSDEVNIPLGYEYDDEWGLSMARAHSVLKFFETLEVPLHNAHLTGYGNTRPFIGNDIDSPYNRRIEVIILDDGVL